MGVAHWRILNSPVCVGGATAKMSWESYVDNLRSQSPGIVDVGICGHDGNIWAKSEGFSATAAQMNTVLTNLDNAEYLATQGFELGSIKYSCLSSVNNVVSGRVAPFMGEEQTGVNIMNTHIVKTGKAAIFAIYKRENTATVAEVEVATEKLGDYLVTMGF